MEKQKKKSVIVLPRDDGICSRLESLFTLHYCIAKYVDREIILVWPINKACCVKFENIFQISNDFSIVYANPLWKVETNNLEIIQGCRLRHEKRYDGIYVGDELIHSNDILNDFDGTTYQKIKKKIEFINLIRLNKHFKTIIKKIKSENSINEKTIGIHIRSLESPKWHNFNKNQLSGKKRLNKLLEHYSNRIIECLENNKNQDFLIESDSKDIISFFKNKFGANIKTIGQSYPIHQNKKIIERDEQSIYDAIIVLNIFAQINYNDIIKLDASYGYFTKFPKLLEGKFLNKHLQYFEQDKIFTSLFRAATLEASNKCF